MKLSLSLKTLAILALVAVSTASIVQTAPAGLHETTLAQAQSGSSAVPAALFH